MNLLEDLYGLVLAGNWETIKDRLQNQKLSEMAFGAISGTMMVTRMNDGKAHLGNSGEEYLIRAKSSLLNDHKCTVERVEALFKRLQ